MATESYDCLDADGEQFKQHSIRHSFRDWVWHSNGSLQIFATEISAWQRPLVSYPP